MQVKNFRPEDFWYIFLAVTRQESKSKGKGEETQFTWRRGHVFEEDYARGIFERVSVRPIVRVTTIVKKGTKKWSVSFLVLEITNMLSGPGNLTL